MIAVAAASATSVAHQPGFCLRDADGDGHPLFGNPQVRPFPESEGGLVFGNWCTSVAVADLDGDGDPDAVVGDVAGLPATGPVQSFVGVFFNAGDGAFEPDGRYAVARRSCSVELADLDGDGDADIATTGELANVVSVLLNEGDGTFAPYTNFPVGQTPCSLKIANVDGDEDLDLVVLNWASSDVSILKNQGSGVFAPEVRVFVGSVTPRADLNMNSPYPGPFLAVGDLDGDGDADIAVPAKGKVKLLLNDGAGAFALAATHPSVATPNAYAVVIADLDGDGDMDLASSSLHNSQFGPNILSIIRNIGGGVFAAPVAYDAGWTSGTGVVQWATSLTSGDIDIDSDIDLVVGHELRNFVMVMRNQGDGTFAPKEPVQVSHGPWFVRFAEVNGDGRLDLAAISWEIRSKLCILLNDGAGSLRTIRSYPPGAWDELWNWVEKADLDDDGDLDLVAANQSIGDTHQVKVLLNNGKGAFDDVSEYSLGPIGASTGESVAIGDLNGDRIPDLVIADDIAQGGWIEPGKVWTMMGAGRGGFAPAVAYTLDDSYPMQMGIADLDGDTDNDVAVSVVEVYPGNDVTPVWRRILIFENSGAGSFSLSDSLPVVQCPWPFPRAGMVVTDLNADGKPDLVGVGGTRILPGAMATFLNSGDGRFLQHQVVTVPPQPESLVAADLNGDGRQDIVILHNHGFSDGVLEEPYLTSWINDGAGTLTAGPARTDARMLTLGRLAAEPSGKRVLLASPVGFGAVVVDTLLPSLTFSDPVSYGVGYLPTAAVFGDFDRDGRLDLGVSTGNDSSISLLLNASCGACYADCDGTGTMALLDFACFQTRYVLGDPYADCNHDGSLTVADFGCFQTAFVMGCP